jgi:MFS transporter, Spinster family, sphingosine-1-phosphate transporter
MLPPDVVDVSRAAPAGASGDRADPAPWHIEAAWVTLIILALINFLNYVDRYVIAALVPFLTAPQSGGGLGLSHTQAGALATAFTVVHSLASIPLGIAADRWLRKGLIALGVGVWSFATAAAGLARSFAHIFAARAAVGIGEATYAPAASALISERFAPALRARALGIFQLGMVVGGGTGIVIGGEVAKHWGWRAAFWVVGAPGLLLAFLALLIHEPRRTRRQKPASLSPAGSLRLDAATPGSVPAVIWINLAGILITFFSGAILFWGPQFILRVRYHGDKAFIDHVVRNFGPLAVVAGLAGTLVGSFLADRMEKVRPGSGRLLTVAVGVFASVPCIAVALQTQLAWLQYGGLVLGVFFNVWYVGPILACLHDVVAPHLRATVTGAYLCLIHLLGDGPSPILVGALDDLTGSLRVGLLIAAGIMAVGGVAALLAMRGSRQVALIKAAQQHVGGSGPGPRPPQSS